MAGDRIFFAGEATHETHPATVVGAIHEGERAALEVHAANGSPGNPPAVDYSGHGEIRILNCDRGASCWE